MRRSLTRSSRVVGGRRCSRYEYGGASYDVCDSAPNAMLVGELFADESLSEWDKQRLLPEMLFPDPAAALELAGRTRFWDMVDSVLWDSMGVDLYGTRGATGREDPVFDWEEDAGRISYAEFLDLVAGLMEAGETPLQQAIYYRTAKAPRENKHNGEYVRAFRARAEHFRLRGAASEGDRAGAQDAAMASAFAAEFAAAERAAREGVTDE